MRISTKGFYGAKAVLDLALHHGTGKIHKADIARRQDIPEHYLAQLLSVLRRAGYVASVRGPAGGHTLAKPPSEITVAEVIELLDGPQTPLANLGGRAAIEAAEGRSAVHDLLVEAEETAIATSRCTTFDDLVNRQREQNQGLHFDI